MKSIAEITTEVCELANLSEDEKEKAKRGTVYHSVRDAVRKHGYPTNGPCVPDDVALLAAIEACLKIKRKKMKESNRFQVSGDKKEPPVFRRKTDIERIKAPSGRVIPIESSVIDNEMRAFRSDALFIMLAEGNNLLNLRGFDQEEYRADVALYLAMDIDMTVREEEANQGALENLEMVWEEIDNALPVDESDSDIGQECIEGKMVKGGKKLHAERILADMKLLEEGLPTINAGRLNEQRAKLLDLTRYCHASKANKKRV